MPQFNRFKFNIIYTFKKISDSFLVIPLGASAADLQIIGKIILVELFMSCTATFKKKYKEIHLSK